jgi:hypothetical protein
MRKTSKRVPIIVACVAVLVAAPGAVWLSLTHQPRFYRAIVQVPPERQEEEAKRFVAQSLQLRNDICNEPNWQAVFTDQQVNAWLAKDLVTHFADQLPPEVHEPRVVFEPDRVTLAFQLDQGSVKSVIWVVARPNVPKGNVLELTLEKIRAGALPVPADKILDRIVEHVRDRGLEVEWKRVDHLPVVTLRYTPDDDREDVRLERVEIRDGQIQLAGRSDRARGVVGSPSLPTRKVLQSKFPRRKLQDKPGVSIAPSPTLRSSAVPTS